MHTRILLSIAEISPVFSTDILAEIGDINKFNNHASVAKYCRLTWHIKKPGNFTPCNNFFGKNKK